MPWKNFLLALFISVYAFKEWELKSPNSNRHQGRSFLLEKQDYKINDDWHLIKGWESHQQWQGTEWNVECTFLSKGSSTNDFPKRQKYPEFHVNETILYVIFGVWLLSLSIMCLRFIHVVSFCCWLAFHYMNVLQCVYLLFEGLFLNFGNYE